MWIMWFIFRFPARDSRCRTISPEEASIGAVPVQEANRLRSPNRAETRTLGSRVIYERSGAPPLCGETSGGRLRVEPLNRTHALEFQG